MQNKKLKYSEIKPLREQLIEEQHGLCNLCQHELDNPCLDHCHINGNIRAVLCRGCNSLLGKLENNLARNKITPLKLKNILENIWEYRFNIREEIHPTHGKKKTRRKK